ncbi:hypothetical protein KIH41_12370 [Litoribacter ruber]|uniref:DUF6787 domain-containing protein n=1 Tax=Litoribacter ruber TaxID=702568 RepID=A0AAP2CKK2_9BACT|nr:MULTISPECIES: DUF6787 family protein [Litoribacter]MBS9523512.1 hypothetical protein [Litoribacter alkaliphilus]MBT0812071.1 hypothetical protein [Litoribacter ruber]
MNKQKTSSPSFLQKLQAKWGLESMWQVVLVLLVFAATGTTIMVIKKPLLDLMGIDMSTGGFWKSTLYFLFVLPLYQIVLLFYGFVFGQFSFFWEKEKKLVRLFSRSRKKVDS